MTQEELDTIWKRPERHHLYHPLRHRRTHPKPQQTHPKIVGRSFMNVSRPSGRQTHSKFVGQSSDQQTPPSNCRPIIYECRSVFRPTNPP